MKLLFTFLIFCMVASCNVPGPDAANLQARVDSLQRKIDNSYRPGLGEFMSGIQVHHEKLWFAGKAGNWALADFETKEIRESIEDISQYCMDRPEAASIPMIKPPLDSIDNAIRNKDQAEFKAGFMLLTNTCNNCHRATKHEFNVIQVPLTPPFSNQVFGARPK